MLTPKGQEALHLMYDSFRDAWIKKYPGYNENDCERAFLSFIMATMKQYALSDSSERVRLYEMIDSIV